MWKTFNGVKKSEKQLFNLLMACGGAVRREGGRKGSGLCVCVCVCVCVLGFFALATAHLRVVFYASRIHYTRRTRALFALSLWKRRRGGGMG